jgi:hypothetical protein
MQKSRLFSLTQWRLALSYAGMMAVILSAVGMLIYLIVAYLFAGDQNLQDPELALWKLSWFLFVVLAFSWLIVLVTSWLVAGKAMKPVYHSYQHIQQFTADARISFAYSPVTANARSAGNYSTSKYSPHPVGD